MLGPGREVGLPPGEMGLTSMLPDLRLPTETGRLERCSWMWSCTRCSPSSSWVRERRAISEGRGGGQLNGVIHHMMMQPHP